MTQTWSYSRLKAFETCPKQFYHTHVLKEFPFQETEAMRYGTEFHKACEDYVRDGKPIPEKFSFARPTVEKLAALPGDKHCEIKLGLTEDLEPCNFFAKNVWVRGIVDLLIIDGDKARVVDYKTGKSARYADPKQLELMSLMVFKHFPQVAEVKAGLLFVIAESFVRERYVAEKAGTLWAGWINRHTTMQKAFDNGVWNPNPSGLCRKHCPVTQCPHNGANK